MPSPVFAARGLHVRGTPADRCASSRVLRPMILLRLLPAIAWFGAAALAGAADPAKALRVATSDIDTLDPHQARGALR